MSKIIPPQMTFEEAVRNGHAGRIVCRGYLDWIKTLPCDTCAAPAPSDPSHMNAYKGTGTKAPDLFVIPQCRRCHDLYERLGAGGTYDNGTFLARCMFYVLRAFWEGRLVWKSQ